MYTKLNYEGYENYLIRQKPLFNGLSYLFRFNNSYGASVVKHTYSYGNENDLWELAVVYFPNESDDKFYLDYDTPITSDVEGYLTNEEVLDLLKGIAELRP